jgi:hypothetical protein
LFLVLRLAFQKGGINIGRFEVGAEAGHRIFDIEGLTGEDIEVDVIRLFNEVGRDVRCLDQLNEGIALLVSIAQNC